jgi:rRNA maturation protein Rpf1
MELMIVLAIVMLLATIGMRASRGFTESFATKKPLDDLKIMAKTAWHRATTEQIDWEVIIRKQGLELRARAASRQDDAEFLKASDQAQKRSDGIQSKQYGPEFLLKVKRFGEATWREPPSNGESWVFTVSGVCEPIEFRVERNSDRGFEAIECAFDPLTAGTRFEEWSDR